MPRLHPFARERTLLFVRGQALPDCNNAAVTTQISAEGGWWGFLDGVSCQAPSPGWLRCGVIIISTQGGSLKICLYLGFCFLFPSLLVWCQYVSFPIGLNLGANLLLAPASTFTYLQLSQGNELTHLHKVSSPLAPENSLLDFCLPHLFSSVLTIVPMLCPVLCSTPRSPAPRVRPLLSPACVPAPSSLAS